VDGTTNWLMSCHFTLHLLQSPKHLPKWCLCGMVRDLSRNLNYIAQPEWRLLWREKIPTSPQPALTCVVGKDLNTYKILRNAPKVIA
jgi:hypothetical protein